MWGAFCSLFYCSTSVNPTSEKSYGKIFPLLLLFFTGQVSLLHSNITECTFAPFSMFLFCMCTICLSEQVSTNRVLLSCFKRLLWLQVCVAQRQFGDYVSCRHTAPCPSTVYIPLYYISLSNDIITIAIIIILNCILF